MLRCMVCNGILRKEEKACFTCGTGVSQETKNTPFAKRISSIMTLVLIGSVLLTGASFFSNRTPPFSACLASSIILLFVKRSADQFSTQRS